MQGCLISISSLRLNLCARPIQRIVLSIATDSIPGHRFHFKHSHLHPRSSSCPHQAKHQQFNCHRRIPIKVRLRTLSCFLLKIESCHDSTMFIDKYERFCCQQFSIDDNNQCSTIAQQLFVSDQPFIASLRFVQASRDLQRKGTTSAFPRRAVKFSYFEDLSKDLLSLACLATGSISSPDDDILGLIKYLKENIGKLQLFCQKYNTEGKAEGGWDQMEVRFVFFLWNNRECKQSSRCSSDLSADGAIH